ncbi:MAG: OmpA family protein [Pseudoalteromonas sp.]
MHNRLKNTLQLCLLVCISSLTACTTYGDFLTGHPTKNLSEPVEKQTSAQVVFFNEAHLDTDSTHTSATVISTQGKVISGLHPQQYTIISTCDGTQSYQVTRGGGAATTIELTATPNSVHYVRLTPSSTSSAISYKVSEHPQIDDVIKDYDERSFLVARHLPNCAKPTEPTTFSFDAGALFNFDGHELDDVVLNLPLEKVVHFIETQKTQSMQVIVSGYTDHLGAPDYNQQLSERRAQAVANYLKSKGYNGKMQVSGFGSADPIVTDCSSSLTQGELIQCLQPNRRVTVSVLQAN